MTFDFGWSPGSWREYPAKHQPPFASADRLAEALARVAEMPPLVEPSEIERLKAELALASSGRAVVLQAGDCAETFANCRDDAIEAQVSLLSTLAHDLKNRLGFRVVTIGRIAGQYAKPRTSPTETVMGVTMPAYLGDAVNGLAPSERRPDPARLVQARLHAGLTMNFLRLLAARRGEAPLFTSHEGLILPFEECQTRRDPHTGRWYNQSAHLLWLGERTRQLSGAHAEYFRGIANPVGIKVGPDAAPDELAALIGKLNPSNDPGKILLITRMGVAQAAKAAPLVAAVMASGLKVTWISDPMHGNTTITADGRKTRAVEDVVAEIRATARVHARLGQALAGLHLEVSGDQVTECLGGPMALAPADLGTRYLSACDPRLNPEQALFTVGAFVDERRLTATCLALHNGIAPLSHSFMAKDL